MKEVQQALQIVNQGLDIAVSAGSFKKTSDVAALHSSILLINNFLIEIEKNNKGKSEQEKPVEENSKTSSKRN